MYLLWHRRLGAEARKRSAQLDLLLQTMLGQASSRVPQGEGSGTATGWSDQCCSRTNQPARVYAQAVGIGRCRHVFGDRGLLDGGMGALARALHRKRPRRLHRPSRRGWATGRRQPPRVSCRCAISQHEPASLHDSSGTRARGRTRDAAPLQRTREPPSPSNDAARGPAALKPTAQEQPGWRCVGIPRVCRVDFGLL